MDLNLITTVLAPIVSGITMFIVGKRGRVVKVDNTEIENLRSIINIQQETIGFLAKRISKLEDEIATRQTN